MVNVKMNIPDEIFEKHLEHLTPQRRTMFVTILLDRYGNKIKMKD